MHHSKKGNQWNFGMKCHIGVDSNSGLVHTVVLTPGNEADVLHAHRLLHGQESNALGDSGYQGVWETGDAHIVVDARGIPLMNLVSGANRHDSKMFEKCVDAISAIEGLKGRPRKRPLKLHADKGYDYQRCRAHLRQRGIASRIARRSVESSERLGKHRWVNTALAS